LASGIFAATLTVSLGASAAESVTGEFTASQSCDAYQSFTKKTNPGALKTAAGTIYQVQEVNRREQYSWVRVVMGAGAPVNLRWVSAECGQVADLKFTQPASRVSKAPVGHVCQTADQYDNYVLASTWQPGFCGFKAGNKADSKPECAALASGSLKAANLTLHGLWPNKKECGINYGHCGSEPLKLKPETVEAIAPWMPNFLYGDSFGAYEWKKHGTCQALDADGYFLKAVAAVKALNASRLGTLITQSVGKQVSKAELLNAIKADDPKAVNSVAFLCSGSSLYEIRVNLPVNFTTDAGLSGLVGANPLPLGSQGEACPNEGILIAVSGKQ
jgi:ribonuclease T2